MKNLRKYLNVLKKQQSFHNFQKIEKGSLKFVIFHGILRDLCENLFDVRGAFDTWTPSVGGVIAFKWREPSWTPRKYSGEASASGL